MRSGARIGKHLGAAGDEHRKDAKILLRVTAWVRPYATPLAISLGLLFVAGLLDLVGPWLTKIAIDQAIPHGDRALLAKVCLGYVGVLVATFLIGYVQYLLLIRTGQSIMHDLRTDLFGHLQRMGFRYFDRTPVGTTVSRVTSDVETLNELLTSGIVTIIADVVTLVGITIVLFWMNPGLAIISFAVLPFLVGASVFFRKKARDGFRATRERVAGMNTVMQETFSGIEVVKLFGREPTNDVLFEEQNAGCRDAWTDTVRAFSIFFPIVQFLLALALALILWNGGGRVIQGALTFGELVAFLQYVQRFFVPLRDLSEKYNVLQAAMAACERIFGILDRTPEEDFDRQPDLGHVSRIAGEIEFENVSFRYRDDEPVLENVSFRVHPGERVALVGATGAGKSTVLSLLLGFYRPTSGRILIDGQDLASLDPRTVRQRIGMVLQDVFLFSADVEWNVRMGDPSIGEDDFERALVTSRAKAVVDRLPLGKGELLGERGRSLSVGQRQLLSFARALARDPDVLLLDEATSSVDAETEGLIQEALEELLRGRTSIVVAHRLSTVRDADRLLVFHQGRVAESGTHDELLARRGLYARLVELQFGTREEEAA
ncbi:MAG: ABC transporter ATP-binding protein [Gemmatimonadetes bacterium]|nr:ABC transporter ATP-binding protein [Gemmatimonadota bacterium]